MSGAIAGMLSNKRLKPTLRIHASVDSYPEMKPVEDLKYLREDMKRIKAECVAMKKALDNWVPEDVAARAEKSLRQELKRSKARLVEMEARLDAAEDEDEEETETEDED